MDLRRCLPLCLLLPLNCLMSCSSRSHEVRRDREMTLIDSIYSICTDIYLWSDNLPRNVPIELYKLSNIGDVLTKIRTYSQHNSGKPLDRWSFAIEQNAWKNFQSNTANSFGIEFVFNAFDDLRVKLVHNQSEAFKYGLRRGDKILEINELRANNLTETLLRKALNGQQISIKYLDYTGRTKNMVILKNEFQISSITKYEIIENKIGYFNFNIFSGGKITSDSLASMFSFFRKGNIHDLIIDIRYNHGGDGLMALEIANLIIPESVSKKLFSRILNNKKYGSLNYSLYFNTNQNSLQLKRVFFITTAETASTSEVLINALQAVMEVKVIGTKTHGKPFGFIPYKVGGNYIFPVAFKTVNANGYGEYYDGIPVDFEVEDDVTHDFGDINESCVHSILKYISSGQFPTSGKRGGRQNIERSSINENQIPAFMYISH